MKSKIKEIIKNLKPELLGVDEIKIQSFKKLGLGECNLNYLLNIENKKFLCRVNIDKENSNKIEIEYENLKKIEHLGIAPKALYFHMRNENFERDLVILEFIEGKPFRMGQKTFTDEQIKKLSQTLSRLHSQNIKLSNKDKTPYLEVFKYAKEFVTEINKYTSNKYESELNEIILKVNKIIPKTNDALYRLVHGDVCPQNVVETKNEIKLIDWESVSYSDPARDIVNVLVDFGLKNNQLELFYSEYFKNRDDESLLERVKIHQVLTRTNYSLWEIMRTFEIINKELPKEYLQKTSAKVHLNEARKQFRELKKLIVVSNLKIFNDLEEYC